MTQTNTQSNKVHLQQLCFKETNEQLKLDDNSNNNNPPLSFSKSIHGSPIQWSKNLLQEEALF